MLFSKSADRQVPDWLTEKPIAHRGLHNAAEGVIENSMTAFEHAIKAGIPIECDIHLSSDLQPVVFHDATLLRLTGDARRLCDVSLSELNKISLTGSDDQIPNLQSVLDLVAGQVPLVIEMKQSPFGHKILAQQVWNILKDYQGRYCIQSFDPFMLKWFHHHAPQVTRGQLSMKSPPKKMPAYRKFMMRHMLLNALSKPHYIGYDCHDIHWWVVQRAVKGNMKLLAWTVSDIQQLKHARQYADNVIFENLPLDLVG